MDTNIQNRATRIVRIVRKHTEIIEATVEIPKDLLDLNKFVGMLVFDGLEGVTMTAQALENELHPSERHDCEDNIEIFEASKPGDRHFPLTQELLDAMEEDGIINYEEDD